MGRIFLVGFMGSGKTTIGQILAQHLKAEWVDLDCYLVKKAGRPISQIFKEQGETEFRKLESKCLDEVLKENYGVISTGGGIISSPDNIKKLQENQTVWLDYPFDCLYERIKEDKERPLVTTYEALHKRFEERIPLYRAASKVHIQCEGKSINDVVEEIIKKLKNN